MIVNVKITSTLELTHLWKYSNLHRKNWYNKCVVWRQYISLSGHLDPRCQSHRRVSVHVFLCTLTDHCRASPDWLLPGILCDLVILQVVGSIIYMSCMTLNALTVARCHKITLKLEQCSRALVYSKVMGWNHLRELNSNLCHLPVWMWIWTKVVSAPTWQHLCVMHFKLYLSDWFKHILFRRKTIGRGIQCNNALSSIW